MATAVSTRSTSSPFSGFSSRCRPGRPTSERIASTRSIGATPRSLLTRQIRITMCWCLGTWLRLLYSRRTVRASHKGQGHKARIGDSIPLLFCFCGLCVKPKFRQVFCRTKDFPFLRNLYIRSWAKLCSVSPGVNKFRGFTNGKVIVCCNRVGLARSLRD